MENLMIKVDNVEFIYKNQSGEDPGVKALSDVGITFEKGQFIAVLGRNGSGKSTFARLLNALLMPTRGAVYIKGMDTRDEKCLWKIRSSAGMVFQNPDNQIVGTTVEEDVAFGPENLGIPPEEIRERVYDALKSVGIMEYSTHAPHLLSGGQKQRVAIAGILAIKPDCIILDEATSMLDPIGRREVMQLVKKLNREEGITIIHITHHMDEATMADRVIVMDMGKVVLDGKPAEVFSNVEMVKSLGLEVPQVTELFYELKKEGCKLPLEVLNVDEAYEALLRAIGDKAV
ncbi:MAG: energy-coupling factor transporter ATPase [Clostridiales bacterium]|nr:energy-coupling factor transporter ATPase [Eubacteriales bacterium]MDH7566928.1 energy-coupling factor transporter ATPase [Clostridiales bacterium]